MRSGVSTNTSIKRPSPRRSRTICRSARCEDINTVNTPTRHRCHQPGHFGAANVLFAILIAESQVAAQAAAHVIAVQQIGADAALMRTSSSAPATVVTRPRKAGKPQHHAAMAVMLFPLLLGLGWACQTTFSSCWAIICLPAGRGRPSAGKCLRISWFSSSSRRFVL